MASDPAAAVSSVLKSVIEIVEKLVPKPPTVVVTNAVSSLAAEELSVKPATEPPIRIVSELAKGIVESDSSKEAPLASKLPASSVENVPEVPVKNVKGSFIKLFPGSGVNNVLTENLDNEESSLNPPLLNVVSKSALAGTNSSTIRPLKGANAAKTKDLQDSSLKDDMVEEHNHWKETAYFLDCNPFLHHVSKYSNWYNNSHQFVRHQARVHIRPQDPTTVTRAFGNLMAPKLVRCLEDSQLRVRQKALLWIVELVATPQGRYQCIKTGLLKALTKRFNEEDVFIKQQIALAVGKLAGTQDACAEMSQLGVIKWLLKMVASSDEKSLLGIEGVLQFLKKENVALQTAATSALMSLTVNIEAKKDFITGSGVPVMAPFIDSSEKVLSFNTLQLATNIAEHPDGRSQLHSQARKVQHLMDTSESLLQKRFAKACLQQLRFKHRPFT